MLALTKEAKLNKHNDEDVFAVGEVLTAKPRIPIQNNEQLREAKNLFWSRNENYSNEGVSWTFSLLRSTAICTTFHFFNQRVLSETLFQSYKLKILQRVADFNYSWLQQNILLGICIKE